MMLRFAGSCSEMVVGRFFGFGTDLSKHDIKIPAMQKTYTHMSIGGLKAVITSLIKEVTACRVSAQRWIRKPPRFIAIWKE